MFVIHKIGNRSRPDLGKYLTYEDAASAARILVGKEGIDWTIHEDVTVLCISEWGEGGLLVPRPDLGLFTCTYSASTVAHVRLKHYNWCLTEVNITMAPIRVDNG